MSKRDRRKKGTEEQEKRRTGTKGETLYSTYSGAYDTAEPCCWRTSHIEGVV
jgi:hypothetical protein